MNLDYYVDDCIIRLHGSQRDETWFYLYSAGRAARWSRFALDSMRALRLGEAKLVDYHFYAGTSAVQTAVEALAWWLNDTLQIGLTRQLDVTFRRSSFCGEVRARLPMSVGPDGKTELDRLIELVGEVQEIRDTWQHRQGYFVQHYSDEDGSLSGWFVPGGEMQPPGVPGQPVEPLLERWERVLTESICAIAVAAVTLQAPQPV